mgnify:CR=1 FL=1
MQMKKIPIYKITDHICRECDGRILEQINSGPAGGGNPVYRCADCGKASSGLLPDVLCWCGCTNSDGERLFMCLSIKDNMDLRAELCLKLPEKLSRTEVISVPIDAYREFLRKKDGLCEN